MGLGLRTTVRHERVIMLEWLTEKGSRGFSMMRNRLEIVGNGLKVEVKDIGFKALGRNRIVHFGIWD